jgi:cyanophycinase
MNPGSRLPANTRATLVAWVLFLATAVPQAWGDGSLLIVGGALQEDNAAVHRALVDAMLPEGKMVIIPAASGRPAESAADFVRSLEKYGLSRDRIAVYPLAVRDDDATADVDESAWSKNAWNAESVSAVSDAAGFWFTGGDQMRITQTLLGEDGGESPLLALIRERLARGAVVGGSSAGAAIMSRDMIAGGISFTALLEPLASDYSDTEDQDSGRLYLSRGLGLFPKSVIDQHFDRKARLGRLVRALAATGQSRGFGIDENTALHVRLGDNRARVLGGGSVTALDASRAKFDFGSTRLASGLEISVIPAGVTFSTTDLSPLEGQGDATVGKEYFGYTPEAGGGMAFANPRLDQALGFDLMDNEARQLDRYSIDHRGRVLIYRFSQTTDSRGFWRSEGSADRYTISKVRFDIIALQTELPPH